MDIRADSLEYIKSTIAVDHDLTGKAIQVALPLTGQAPSVWFGATVTDVTNVTGPPFVSTATYRLLVGPGGGAVTLVAGNTYDWCVKVTDTPEVPVRRAGQVVATVV